LGATQRTENEDRLIDFIFDVYPTSFI